jgi:hypothetical protein
VSDEQDETGAHLNQVPCENCGDTRRYHRLVMDPQHARRFSMAERATCGHQHWTELPDK